MEQPANSQRYGKNKARFPSFQKLKLTANLIHLRCYG
jgi:hypothetical protein